MSWFDDFCDFVSDTCDSVKETLGNVASKVDDIIETAEEAGDKISDCKNLIDIIKDTVGK